MSEVLTLPTEREGVYLREWLTEADDAAYLAAVDEDRPHLSRHGDTTAETYQTIQDVRRRRLNPGNHLRLGIWDAHDLRGGITAKPRTYNTEVEIGYWLRKSAEKRGYATLAVKALTAYLAPSFSHVFAEVHVNNHPSMRVLERSGYTPAGEVQRIWGRAIIFELV